MNKFLNKRAKGQIGNTIIPVIIGVVMLFVGVFTLSTVEQVFDVTQCTNTNYAGSPALRLNGSAGMNGQSTGTGLQNYSVTVRTDEVGTCSLVVALANESATNGYIEVRHYPSDMVILNITSNPANTATHTLTGISTTTGTYAVNYTHKGVVGDNWVNVTTSSYMRCCSATEYKDTVGGQNFSPVTASIATSFVVFGFVLIVYGLSSAILTLKNSF